MLKCLNLLLMILLSCVCLGQNAADSLPGRDSVSRPVRQPVINRQPVLVNIINQDSLYRTLPDSLKYRDSLPSKRMDSVFVPAKAAWNQPSSKFINHPFYRFTNPTRLATSFRKREGKESLFYVVIGLLLFFAIIRNGFARYIQDLLKIFFRTTVRQRQIKEQLLQSPLPSLLLNIFFLVSMGMFLALVIQTLGYGQGFNFWVLMVYCIALLGAMYFLKFVVLKFIGWILQVRDAADTYIFIVFLTNKVIGMLLIPFIVVLAFTYGSISQVALTAGLLMIAGFFAYRYFLSFISVYRQLRISFFHFLLYLLAFEIVPLLLINKLLFTFLVETS